MNQALAKQTRRDIRRAFGSEALQTITLRDSEMLLLKRALATHDVRLGEHAKELQITGQACDERWLSTADAQRRIVDRLEVFRRPFLGRLRWLFLGR